MIARWLNRSRPKAIFAPRSYNLQDLLGLERHGARTLHNLRARIAQRLLTLTACVYLNHWLGRPTCTIADLTA